MKKAFIVGLTAMMLTACGGETPVEEDNDPIETETPEVDEATEVEPEMEEDTAAEGEFYQEFNEEIADTENIRATLMSVEKVVDETWDDERILVTFEVENKMEDTIEVQAREVSADNRMIDQSMLSMSQEVSGGKLADAVLTIQNYDGDLPDIEDNIEMILHIFSWDDYDFTEQHDVHIDLN
ncbi:hypothetical protein [Desertibacillus haloalkaliphilus]|uniref:hypothetical protein n=1 Tax=Desertibacillus haloalkaliphilus TaxID=1328930 RepID=UPI001C27B1A1|nr:hypothetical protein [Desertibacillus haloalkaliphilus]MBU8906515.1 hypothetical protein [Desertibacillus haloalkaliphilus]